ncbi:MAG TPA: hypothetical protein VGH19_00050 [Verrucomicrobiae bacterium]
MSASTYSASASTITMHPASSKARKRSGKDVILLVLSGTATCSNTSALLAAHALTTTRGDDPPPKTGHVSEGLPAQKQAAKPDAQQINSSWSHRPTTHGPGIAFKCSSQPSR